METKNGKFRTDINGLRAWAVVAVVFYHFGVGGFSGGFVGVDVFFVISGFLMTGIVVESLERNGYGGFSIAEFYMARARRILPALIVLCAILLALGWWLLVPADYRLLGSHVMFSAVFLSNFKYWDEAGYFDAESHEKWLLHTWSLAVEWQFYLLLPLILVAVWKLRPGRSSIIIISLAGLLASLALSVMMTPLKPTAAFYLLPVRAWELLAGGLVYLLASRQKPAASLRAALEFGGFALIIGAIVVFDSTSSWPGWRALVPVAGAALILSAARSGSCWTGHPVAQWLGSRSYSLYLWHWPIVVALTYLEQQDNPLAVALGLGLALVMGHLSYHLVESPLRHKLNRPGALKTAPALLGSALVVTVTGGTVHAKEGIAGRLAPEIEAVSREVLNENPRRDECLLLGGVASPSCIYGGSHLRAIVMGDSHANATVSAVAAAAPSPDSAVMEWAYSACPIIDGVRSHEREQCGAFVDWAIARLNTVPRDIPVVIVNRHAQFAFGKNEVAGHGDVPQVYFTRPYKRAEREFLEEYAQNLIETVCQVAKDRPVYLVRPIPEMRVNVPVSMARAMVLGRQKDVFITRAEYERRQAFIWRAQDAARDRCGAKILDPLPYLCSGSRCYGERHNRPLYRDDDHLSEFGNKLLVPMFAEIFRQADKASSPEEPRLSLPN